MGFFFLFISGVYGQNPKLADSLELEYLKGNFEEKDRLKILKELAVNHLDSEKKLHFSEALIQLALALDSTGYLYSGYLQKGNALSNKGEPSDALNIYFKAAEIANEENSSQKQGSVNTTIADVYSKIGNHNNAIEYYQSAIDIFRKENDSTRLARTLYNAGDEYFKSEKYESAMVYFDESSLICQNTNILNYYAYNLGSIGMIFAELGKYVLAKKNISEAIEILDELEVYIPVEFMTYMSDIYANENDLLTAFGYARKGLEVAQKYDLKKDISETYLKLSELYEQAGNIPESFKYYKSHIAYTENNLQIVQQMADLRTDFEIQKKQDEIVFLEKEAVITDLRGKRQRTISYVSIGAFALVLLLVLVTYRRFVFVKKTNRIIQKETDKSEKLLLNILPEETAIELKKYGKVQAKKFNSVSVMFTDFKDFTHYSQKLSPDALVKSVDYYFSKFDRIIKKYDLEKIKTIGDAYMCAGGLPFPSKDHPIKMVQAAFEISEFIKRSKTEKKKDVAHFDVRIGINTGPVVAGVVGSQKFAYDIWGDTVNVASRMESASTTGKINVSENTYELIKNVFDCNYRGEIFVRNKGLMKMYFVNNAKDKESYKTWKEGKIEVQHK